MSGPSLFQNILEIKLFILGLFVLGPAAPLGKWNPNVAGAILAPTYLLPIVASHFPTTKSVL